MVRFDLLGEAPIGGDSAADAARSRPRSCRARGAREGAGERGGKGEGERAGPGGVLLNTRGGGRARGGGRGCHGDGTSMAPVSPLWRQEEGEREERMTGGPHMSGIYSFPFSI